MESPGRQSDAVTSGPIAEYLAALGSGLPRMTQHPSIAVQLGIIGRQQTFPSYSHFHSWSGFAKPARLSVRAVVAER